MIEIFEGRLGGGKSFSAVMRILGQLGSGGSVYTNIELNWKNVEKYILTRFGLHVERDQYKYLEEEKISRFFVHVPPSQSGATLAVIDEAHLFWNARDWDKTCRDFLGWLTQSRKVGVDIIFISQSQLNMDKQFIRLIQYIWRFRDMARFTVPGLGMRLPFVGDKILQIQFDYDGKTYLHRHFARKDPAIFACYESNALLKPIPGYETMMLTEKKARRRLQPKTKRKPMWKTYGAMFLIVSLLVSFFAYRQYKKFSTPLETPKPVVASVLPKFPVGPPRAEAPKDTPSAYDIVTESFRGSDGTFLKTDTYIYRPGMMTPHGMCVQIQDSIVKIKEPNGRTLYVVSDPNVGPLQAAIQTNAILSKGADAPPLPAPTPVIVKAPEKPVLSDANRLGHTFDSPNAKRPASRQTPQ